MGLPKDGYFIVCLITILLLFENSETLRSQIGRIYGTNECAVCGMDFSLLTINRRRHWSYFSTFFSRFWRPQRPVFSTKCPLEDAWGLYEHLSTSFCVKKSKISRFCFKFLQCEIKIVLNRGIWTKQHDLPFVLNRGSC